MVDLTLRVNPKVDYLQVNFKTTDTGKLKLLWLLVFCTQWHIFWLLHSIFSSNSNLTLHTGESLYGRIM